ncbi:glycolipid transfer protein [Thelephora ganbajun]|uniref:Glycolipid transfer protein n=1 Tax=Thelephora ganbajun TaxID=370292 RepID=A0ACB6Z9P4_THEGA|nr:glycolipid transfer protein [Thelephora ganbajun]
MATVTPYFETVKSFADVPVTSDGVETASFLDASDGFVNMFDLLGIGVFSFVQVDLRANIGGVRSRYTSHQQVSSTLETLVTSEAQEGTRQSTACLVRLIRGLLFTCRALENMQTDHTSELRTCFRRSYDDVLRHHHGWLIQSAVILAITAVPSRPEFYRRISQGASYEKLDTELAKWLEGLNQIVVHMKRFLDEGGYGTV